jgi:hypothetical protein
MIVDDLDPFRRAFAPDEADWPLIVDPNTVLNCLRPFQGAAFTGTSENWLPVLRSGT